MLQRVWIVSVLLVGCTDKETAETADDTGSPTIVDTATTDTNPEDTAPPEETASPEDTSPPDDTAPEDTDPPDYYKKQDTGDTLCATATASFTDASGVETDYTSEFTDGTEVLLEEDGTLAFCPGEWFVRLNVKEASVDIVGLGKTRDETVVSSGESGTVLSFRGPNQTINVSNLVVERGAALGSGNRSSGGGLRCADDTEVNVRDVTFTRNQAYDGAAIYVSETCRLTVDDSLFLDNDTIDDGAGIRVDGGTAEVTNSTFSGNTGRDGAAAFTIYGAMSFDGCTFEDNNVSYYGGAMVNYYGSIEVSDSTFTDHSASYSGGAIYTVGDLTLDTVTFDDSTGSDAAIYTYGTYGTLTGTDVTFTDSSPADVYLYGTGGGPAGGGGSYDFEPNASFSCAGSSCTSL